jgi:hypothetical protein
MTEKIKFHLDESVERVISDGLRRREIDVTTTSEVEMMGAEVQTSQSMHQHIEFI